MIIDPNKVNFISEPPFFAKPESNGEPLKGQDVGTAENKTVSFTEGKVFQCFNSAYEGEADGSEPRFSRGAAHHIPTNMSESFPYHIGDQFYLRCDKEGESSRIVKSSILDNEQRQEGDILIWEVIQKDDEIINTQYLSDHVFLQNKQEYRQIAFTPYLLQEYSDGSKRFRMNGGFVNIFNKNISRFIPSFEYTLEKDEKRFYYVQIETEITKESSLNQVFDEQLKYIEEYKITDIRIIHRDEEITGEEKTANEPFVGKPCAVDVNSAQAENYDEERKKGKHWQEIPNGGNVDVKLETINVDGITLNAVVRRVRLAPDEDGDFITTQFVIGSNLDDEERFSKCKYPPELPFEGEFLTLEKNDEGVFEEGPPVTITGTVKHVGKGVYEEKVIDVPSLSFDVSQDGAIGIVEAFPPSNPCGSPRFLLTRQENRRTSFLRMFLV
tara:strand:+ start:1810 stop:3132 length:1323 start_codon:yes stop_codon:yes gene_type:complete